jgi:hypothetical protein
MATPFLSENSLIIKFATTPAVFLSGIGDMVSADKPEILILIPLEAIRVIVTLSLGFSIAKPKTSKPGPKLALVAGALTVI